MPHQRKEAAYRQPSRFLHCQHRTPCCCFRTYSLSAQQQLGAFRATRALRMEILAEKMVDPH